MPDAHSVLAIDEPSTTFEAIIDGTLADIHSRRPSQSMIPPQQSWPPSSPTVDIVLWWVFWSCIACDVGAADGSWRSACVRIAAMSSSVADGIALERNEKNVGPRIVIASTFLIRVVLVVECRALVAERALALFAFGPDSA